MEEKKIGIKSKKEIKKKLNSSVKKKKIKTPPKKSTTKKPKVVAQKRDIKKVEETKITSKKVISKVKSKKEIKKPTSKVSKKEKKESILPKEWQEIAQKKNDKKPDNFKTKLQEKMFEELEPEVVEKKKKEDKNKYLKKAIILISIVFAILLLSIAIDIYRGQKNILTFKYKEYNVGEKIKLKDNSFWIVVDKSLANNKEVILLKETIIDINNDNKYDNNDKLSFSSTNKVEYETSSPNSVGQYLEFTYKKKLNNSIGKINEIRILKSKEYVKMRDNLGFPYDWKKENILAGNSLGNWWIEGANKNNVFAVTTVGAYKLYKPKDYNYIRPVIVIDKDLI